VQLLCSKAHKQLMTTQSVERKLMACLCEPHVKILAAILTS
jgi:hypothetical protein